MQGWPHEWQERWDRAARFTADVWAAWAGLSPAAQAAVTGVGVLVALAGRRRGWRRKVRRARRRRRASRRFRRWLWRGLRSLFTFRHHRPVVAEPGGPTVLYRHYDDTGRLLYVGITDAGRGGRRWNEHANDKPWFPLVARSEISHPYPTRADALYAEAVAIRDENPVYNICRPDPDRVGPAAI